jgi:peptide/nickel transport system substrate-binding protein
MTIQRIKRVLLAAVSATVLLSAPVQAGDRPLRVGEIWEITTIDPIVDGTLMKEKALIVETLVNGMPDFSLAPGLATNWERTGDLTWLFHIRPGVTFHDGTPLTAEAVKASLEHALTANEAARAYTKIASLAAEGDLELEITTTEPYPPLPASLEYASTAIVGANSPRTAAGGIERPIGTGPFQLKEWHPAEQTFTAVRYEGYWGDKPSIPAIEFRAVPDPTTRSLEIQKGDIDFTAEVPYGDLDRLVSQGITVSRHVTARVYVMNFGSLKDTSFADIRVRKALSMAINRDEIAQYVLFGMGRPAIGPFDPGMVFANTDLKAPVHDLEAARALLSEAGYEPGTDGLVHKDGTRLAFTLYTYPQRPGLVPMAEAIQGQLRQIGVSVEVKVESFDAISKDMKPGDARLAAFATTMFPDPDFFLRGMYASDGVNNTWGYENPQIDAILETALSAPTEQDRQTAYDTVQALALADEPVLLVDYYGVNVVMKPGVKNYTFNPSAHDYMLDPRMTLTD